MAFDKEARIITLLVIDTVFLFIELFSGYAVGSLALISDAFHMLNDVMSLFVAWWALKLANSPSSAKNSYGWQRAEVLGALINGVFLLALCFSIFMEAIQRLVNVPEVSNPKLVIIVGSFGLLSNIVGLFLFHDHGHSHGHSHGHGDSGHDHDHTPAEPSSSAPTAVTRQRSSSRGRSESFGSMYGHPALIRQSVIDTAQEYGYGRSPGPINLGNDESAFSPRDGGKGPLSPLSEDGGDINPISHHVRTKSKNKALKNQRFLEEQLIVPDDSKKKNKPLANDHNEAEAGGHSHDDHDHDHDHDHDPSPSPKASNKHEHTGGMNMRGVWLHVLGDALGNIGVILSGLIILLCKGEWRFYADPAISLFITCIIFSTALPLVKSASYILLQGVPTHISLEDVRATIRSCPGIVSLHELHVWQLSEKTVVASVHVLVSRDVDYMETADLIRKKLHEFGIHSITIQPEFGDAEMNESEISEATCLIRCPPEDCGADACCPPPEVVEAAKDTSNGVSGHSH